METQTTTASLVFYTKKIYASQITDELRNRWKLSKDEATLCLRNLRNSIHVTGTYLHTCFETYTSDFLHKRLSGGDLIQHLAVLALYANALQSNKLKQGSLVQEWNPAHGWHTALNRMFLVAHTPKHPVTGPDLCTLTTRLNTPDELLLHLYQMFKFHCGASTIPHSESFSSLSNAVPGGHIRLGRRNANEIVFLYTIEKTRCEFSISLTPNVSTGMPRRFQGTYRLGIKWNTDADTPLANFAIEDLIAKCVPFGPMEITLPLLTAPAKRTA